MPGPILTILLIYIGWKILLNITVRIWELYDWWKVPKTNNVPRPMTMDDRYTDGSDDSHIYCLDCGGCKTCGDCPDEPNYRPPIHAKDFMRQQLFDSLTYTCSTNVTAINFPVFTDRTY